MACLQAFVRGIADTIDHGDFVWWVCLGVALFNAVKSTTHRGLPSGFGVISILLHHFTGSLTGTFSSTPRATLRSNPCLTAAFQCKGTGLGMCTATGEANSSVNIFNAGAESIRFRG